MVAAPVQARRWDQGDDAVDDLQPGAGQRDKSVALELGGGGRRSVTPRCARGPARSAQGRTARVHISVVAVPVRPGPIRAGRSLGSGRVLVEVLDDGPGVDPETAREVFDPFFATGSGGTGLGLYVAREPAATNDAQPDYAPRPSGRSCFRVTFAA